MFPNTFFSLFPPFPRNNKIFVAMSFDPQFNARWNGVIEPAIINAGFDPHRVDNRNVSDSILTEILDGISNASLIIADISVIGELNGKPIRNANVLYEVGLAHAKRLPEEILMFRSDDKALLFDTYNVRVNPYDPDGDPTNTREKLISHIHIAIREVVLQRSLAVEQGANLLDLNTLGSLVRARSNGLSPPDGQGLLVTQELRSIERALELGMLQIEFSPASPLQPGFIPVANRCKYRLTTYGLAVLGAIDGKIGLPLFWNPDHKPSTSPPQ